jgi:hypothetical protein
MLELTCPRLQFSRDSQRLISADDEHISVLERRGKYLDLAIPATRALAAFGDQMWTVGDAGLERWGFDGRT